MSSSHDLLLQSDLNQIAILEEFLTEICEEYHVSDDLFPDIMLAVTEACTNGIIHGNQFDPQKTVTVQVSSDSNTIQFTVTDQGAGFNPNNLPNPVDEKNLLKSGGRGVYLMKHYASTITYNDKGNQVRLRFNLDV